MDKTEKFARQLNSDKIKVSCTNCGGSAVIIFDPFEFYWNIPYTVLCDSCKFNTEYIDTTNKLVHVFHMCR